jgi:hypothetical protein
VQTPFPITYTPTIGGSITVIGGTTTTITGISYSSGNYTYTSTSWVAVFGGETIVYNGTTQQPITTTVTPHPYPTTTDSTSDPMLNTRTTHRSTASDDGSDSSGPQCTPSLVEKCETSGGCKTPFLPDCPSAQALSM